jgi:hypothetical protein
MWKKDGKVRIERDRKEDFGLKVVWMNKDKEF